MHKTAWRLLICLTVSAGVALMALSATSVQAATETVTTNTITPIEGYGVSCTGEFVHYSGTLHTLFHNNQTSGGTFVGSGTRNYQSVTGVGLTSGDTYDFTLASNVKVRVNAGVTGTLVGNGTSFDETTGQSWSFQDLFHETVNADGVVTAFVDNISLLCS